MSREPSLKTRRDFLRATALGAATTLTNPSFLAQTFATLQADAAGPIQSPTGRDASILVVLQMAGGNDATQWPPAIAAASVTRTSSSARLRSGSSLPTARDGEIVEYCWDIAAE